MAIEAAVASADTLEEARKEVADLTGSIGISLNDRELLSCDSKMDCRDAVWKNKAGRSGKSSHRIILTRSFQEKPSPRKQNGSRPLEFYWTMQSRLHRKEVRVFLSSKKQGDFLELTVSNPAPPLSNTEFMALFGKGVTTKANRDGHGFGLYNILRMTERYHGKILTRNESILNENYVVFVHSVWESSYNPHISETDMCHIPVCPILLRSRTRQG